MPDLETTPPLQPDAAVRPVPDPTEPDDEPDEEPARRARPSRTREGLPSSYRMRHAPHYVEQLMGGGPIQTVRHVAVDQVHAGAQGEAHQGTDSDDITELTASIRQVGVLQPLLVIQAPGPTFHLIAGERRWRAARAAGLKTVPCLVVHADASRAAELRAQAAVTASPVREGEVGAGEGDSPRETTPLEPAVPHPAPRSDLHQSVIADLMAIEERQASTVEAAGAFVSDARILVSDRIDWTDLIHDLRRHAVIEARLRGIWLEWPETSNLRAARADGRALAIAWSALLQAAFVSASPGDRVTVSIATPRIRPAIIFSLALESACIADCSGHGGEPATFGGPHGEVLLASATHSARRQGGRLSVTSHRQGVTLEFVIPQALAYWQ